MKRIHIIALVIFVIAVAGLFAMSPRTVGVVQSKFLGLFSPFLNTGSSLQKRLTALNTGLKTLDELERENKVLLVENKELKATTQLLRDLESENTQLRKALEYRERSAFKLLPARIISRTSSTWWNTIQIDRGFEDGIDKDMPVVTEDGLVGKTTTVAKHAATVVLIADENCKVAVTVEGTREQGIVQGERISTTSQPQISLSFLSKSANLQPGQKVVTSGVGGVYPANIMVGVIQEFQVRALDGYATITPAVDLATLEDVFVITGNK